MNYIVIELQTDSEGKTSNIITAHEDKAEAESKYHSILSAAALSDVNIHAAVLLDERGNLDKSEYYIH